MTPIEARDKIRGFGLVGLRPATSGHIRPHLATSCAPWRRYTNIDDFYLKSGKLFGHKFFVVSFGHFKVSARFQPQLHFAPVRKKHGMRAVPHLGCPPVRSHPDCHHRNYRYGVQ
ncbi:MAG: hypothetical protein IID61_06330 [SAR324 cluster bacterium]|nr:hypothetical protein [SAR324 cluster bacterium]